MMSYFIKNIGGRNKQVSKSTYYRVRAKMAVPRITIYSINNHPIAREIEI